ncbi:MAG: hypothetical protein RH916_06920 [Vicingaceae bacterium]
MNSISLKAEQSAQWIGLLMITLSLSAQTMAQTGICLGDSISLNAGQNYIGNVQWQSSNDNFIYLDIQGATTDPYTLVPTSSKYYRAKILANTCNPEYSDTSFVPVSFLQEFNQSTTTEFSVNTVNGLDTIGDVVKLIASGNLNLGNGSDGAFLATADTSIQGGVYNFTSFTINSNVVVTVTDTIPLELFCTGSATINGTLTLAGEDGGNGINNGAPGAAGAGGGGGGYDGGKGGDGGATTSSTYHGADGEGPSPGKGGITEYVSSLDGQGGGGGGHGTAGGNSYHSGGGGGIGGSAFGSNFLSTLTRGSGGGGGAGDDDTPGVSTGDDGGGGGGGGGGAVKISANSLTVGSSGAIDANGGDGGTCGNGGSGGGGAGGAIYLVSYSITNGGDITADGGTSNTQQLANSVGGDGGEGRIRLDYISYTNTGTMSPVAGYVGPAGTFNASGTMETGLISPGTSNFCDWGAVEYDVDTSATGVSLVIDVLNSSGSTVAGNVTSGTDLSTLPAVASLTGIKLKATLSSTVNTSTPILKEWKVKYYIK